MSAIVESGTVASVPTTREVLHAGLAALLVEVRAAAAELAAPDLARDGEPAELQAA